MILAADLLSLLELCNEDLENCSINKDECYFRERLCLTIVFVGVFMSLSSAPMIPVNQYVAELYYLSFAHSPQGFGQSRIIEFGKGNYLLDYQCDSAQYNPAQRIVQ